MPHFLLSLSLSLSSRSLLRFIEPISYVPNLIWEQGKAPVSPHEHAEGQGTSRKFFRLFLLFSYRVWNWLKVWWINYTFAPLQGELWLEVAQKYLLLSPNLLPQFRSLLLSLDITSSPIYLLPLMERIHSIPSFLCLFLLQIFCWRFFPWKINPIRCGTFIS